MPGRSVVATCLVNIEKVNDIYFGGLVAWWLGGMSIDVPDLIRSLTHQVFFDVQARFTLASLRVSSVYAKKQTCY